MVGWVKGFDPLFEIYYLSVIAYDKSQINISKNPLPILQKTIEISLIEVVTLFDVGKRIMDLSEWLATPLLSIYDQSVRGNQCLCSSQTS